MPLDPLESEIWRQAMAGQRPDPAALFQPPPAPDPSAGLPPEATASTEYAPAVQQALGVGSGAPAPLDLRTDAPASAGLSRLAEAQTASEPAERAAVAQALVQPGQSAQPAAQPPAPVARAGAGAAATPGTPAWLQQYAGQEGLRPEPPERDPHLPGIPETPGEGRIRQELQTETFAGVEDQYEAQKYALEAQMRAQQAAEEARQQVDMEQRQRQQERVNRMREREARYREMADAAAAEPIDGNRLWNNASTGEKIMQGIAVFLGTLGTAAGGPNFALQKIEADINRDLEAQKANRDSKYKRLADEATLYDMAAQSFDDEATIDAAARESAYRKVVQQLESFAQHVQDPARREAADAMKRELDARILDAEQQRRRGNEMYIMQIEAARAKAAAAGAPKKPNEAMFVPNRGFARDPKALEGARGLEVSANEALAAINRLDELRKTGAKSGAFGIGSKEYNEAKVLRGKVVASVAKTLAGGFNPSQQMEEKAEQLVPDPTSWGSGYEGKADGLRRMVQQTTEAGMEQYIKHRTPAGWVPESER